MAYLCYFSIFVPLPSKEYPLRIYDQNLKSLYCKALKSAHSRLDLLAYGFSDPHILKIIQSKKHEGVEIHTLCDARGSPKHPIVNRIKGTGLMHTKLAVIDEALVLLGSANLTPTSLEMHHNCVLGVHSIALAHFFRSDKKIFNEHGLSIWKLPEPSALPALINTIDQAKHTIKAALFNLTHPELIHALERAQERGVIVTVIIDRYTRNHRLSPLIHVRKSKGPELMHNKWAFIDESLLVIGSANWTKAAFNKNREILAIVSGLEAKQRANCRRIWRTLTGMSTKTTM